MLWGTMSKKPGTSLRPPLHPVPDPPDPRPGRRSLPDTDLYPIEPFRLVETRFTPSRIPQTETLFALSNGYMGIRGSFEEATPVYRPGCYLNGFHETWPIVYGEEAYGYAKNGQTAVAVPDASIIRLFIDDEPMRLDYVHLLEFERILDQRSATLTREVLFETHDGRRIGMRSIRMVSLEHRHMALFRYEVTVLDAHASLGISSELSFHRRGRARAKDDPRVGPQFGEDALAPGGRETDGARVIRDYATNRSGLRMACGINHHIETVNDVDLRPEIDDGTARVMIAIDAAPGVPVRIDKFAGYHYSAEAPADDLRFRVRATLDTGLHEGFDQIRESQRRTVTSFWRAADVEVEGDNEVQHGLRFNLFQVMQAATRAEGRGIPAKGLTGEGYEGHCFWDADVYITPVLIYTQPHLARNLLRFRYNMLEEARERARELGHPGVLFPWRTIDGHEASAHWAAGTAQYHINADIVYALRKYTQVTGDTDFMFRYGAEILVETARLWVDLGFFSDRHHGQFVINKVTGPDEYTTVVENNAFTNLMAKENLLYAAQVIEWLEEEHPEEYRVLSRRTGLEGREVSEWVEAGHKMYVPYDERAGVHLQDDDFLQLEPWDFAGTPPDKYPLLLHFHPLTIYRHQVIKQADVVMAVFLLGHHFSIEEKRRVFDYYDPLTTMDSSLSACVQSIVANEVGHYDKADEYFWDNLVVDLADSAGNVKDGAHLAAAAGSWMTMVYGYAGMQDFDARLRFSPRLNERWERVRFPLLLRDRRLIVDIEQEQTTYTVEYGGKLPISHDGEPIVVAPGEVITRPNRRVVGDSEQPT